MPLLLINADDYGVTDGVSQGIIQALEADAITATTIMACADGAQERIARHATILSGRAGAHLQLTRGIPCLPPESVPSLVDAEGRFPNDPALVLDPNPDEVTREWAAQCARLCSLGVPPTHLDAHHHIHLHPNVLPVYVALAKDMGLPARCAETRDREALEAAHIPVAHASVMDWYDTPDADALHTALERATTRCPADGVIELMVHPGLADKALEEVSDYVEKRKIELDLLCSAAARGVYRTLSLTPTGPRQALLRICRTGVCGKATDQA